MTAATVTALRLDDLQLTQLVRAANDEALIGMYALAMEQGAAFPPIVVFTTDGREYHVGDGIHRGLAAIRAGASTILGDVRVGTQGDALWYALGANKTHGARLTLSDKRHAIQIAVARWPDVPQHEIAAQVGCSQQFVSQVVSLGGARIPGQFAKLSDEKAEAIAAALKAGQSVRTVAKTLHASIHTIKRIRERQQINVPVIDKSAVGRQQRLDQIRTMAADGYTTRQICAAVGYTNETVHKLAKRNGIDIAADRVVGKTLRHDSNRIVSQIVMDAENLIAGSDLIDYAELATGQIPDWLKSLKHSRDALSAFIRRLMQERAHEVA